MKLYLEAMYYYHFSDNPFTLKGNKLHVEVGHFDDKGVLLFTQHLTYTINFTTGDLTYGSEYWGA
jgi:hypothetical protein